MNMVVITGEFPVLSHTFVLREVEALRQAGWSVAVIASRPGREEGWEQARHFNIDRSDVVFLDWRTCRPEMRDLPGLNRQIVEAADLRTYGGGLGLRRLGFFSRLARERVVRGADLIHCHWVESGAGVGLGLSRVLSIPFTVTAHDGHLPQQHVSTLVRIQEAASGIACVSRAWADSWASRTGSSDRLCWIPNGIRVEEFACPVPRRNPVPVIVAVSNCLRSKRPDDIVRALHLIRDQEFVFRFVGGGPFEGELRAVVAELGLGARVQFLGPQPHGQVRHQLAAADIYVSCSERESFGIATAEAMASGLPVVVTRTAGAKDLVLDGITGFAFEVGDLDDMADQLHLLLHDEATRWRMGLAGRKRVEDHFSWGSHMDRMFAMWTEAVTGGR